MISPMPPAGTRTGLPGKLRCSPCRALPRCAATPILGRRSPLRGARHWSASPCLLVLAGAAALGMGCIDVEESVSLRRDLSGTAALRVTVDREMQMKYVAFEHHVGYLTKGDLTPREIDMAWWQYLLAKQGDKSDMREDLRKMLPPGVSLLAMTIAEQGRNPLVRDAELAFDDVRKLRRIALQDPPVETWFYGLAMQDPPVDVETPFYGLEVVDEGETVLVSHTDADPLSRIAAILSDIQERMNARRKVTGASPSPAERQQVAAAIDSARLVFRLDSPFEVIETNATHRDGGILTWEIRGSDPIAKREAKLTARLKK